MSFLKQVEEEFLPSVALTGLISKVEPPKKSETEGSPYYSSKVTIKTDQGVPRNELNYWFVFQPGWLSGEEPGNRGERFVYRKNIYGPDKSPPAFLEAASEDFESLDHQLETLAADGGLDLDGALELLSEFVGNRVGLVVKQQRDKIEETDPETGEEKVRYVRTANYEVDRFFRSDDVRTLEKSADKARTKQAENKQEQPSFKVAWEEGSDPFGA